MKRQKRRETLFETEPNGPNDLFPDFSFFHQPREISKSNITVPEIFAIFFFLLIKRKLVETSYRVTSEERRIKKEFRSKSV